MASPKGKARQHRKSGVSARRRGREQDQERLTKSSALQTQDVLADLAARIKAEHEATIAGLKRSIEHAMKVGDLLINAKSLVKRGQWLPWLEEHCAMSERTAQLYMRVARHRATVEGEGKSARLADLTL